MPASSPNNKPVIQTILRKRMHGREHYSVLDVGVGYWHCGKVVREANEDVFLVGIEIFRPYIKEEHELWYDKIYIADASELIKSFPVFDTILLIDVVEHLEREKGIEFIGLCKNKSKHLLISVPIIDYPQGEVFGNPHEAHLTQWKEHEMIEMGSQLIYKDDVIGVFEWEAK